MTAWYKWKYFKEFGVHSKTLLLHKQICVLVTRMLKEKGRKSRRDGERKVKMVYRVSIHHRDAFRRISLAGNGMGSQWGVLALGWILLPLLWSCWSPVSLNICWPISQTILAPNLLEIVFCLREHCGGSSVVMSLKHFPSTSGCECQWSLGRQTPSDRLMLSVSWWERSQQTLANDRRLTSHAADGKEVEVTTAEDAKRWDAKKEVWRKGEVLLAKKQCNKNKQMPAGQYRWKINKSSFAFKMTWEWEQSRNHGSLFPLLNEK